MTDETHALLERAQRAAAPVEALALRARLAADAARTGRHRRKIAGAGEEFWQYRQYMPGDPAALIDWRKTARAEHAMVRERERERPVALTLWCDASASMAFRSAGARDSKRDYARVLALALAELALEAQERVHVLGEGRAFSGGSGMLGALAEALCAQTEKMRPEAAPRRALAVVFSDFWQPPEDVSRLLRALVTEERRALLVQVMDPSEAEFPFRGHAAFEDASGQPRRTLRKSESVREAYLAALAAHQRTLTETAAKAGARFLSCRTDEAESLVLMRIIHLLSEAEWAR